MGATMMESLGGLLKRTYGKAKKVRRKAQDMLGQKDGSKDTKLSGDINGREYLKKLNKEKGA